MSISLHIFGKIEQIDIIDFSIKKYSKKNNFHIEIYCPDNVENIFKKKYEKYGCRINKDSILDPDFQLKKDLMAFLASKNDDVRLGWYYQQYLKIKSVEMSDSNSVVILDGDTYVDIDYLCDAILEKKISCTKEDVTKYNSLIQNIMCVKISNECSFIANYGYIEKKLLLETVGSIDAYFLPVIRELYFTDTKSDFSEYQLFAQIMLLKGWRANKIKFFRRADLLSEILNVKKTINILLMRGYDAIAFESMHSRSIFKVLGAVTALLVGVSW